MFLSDVVREVLYPEDQYTENEEQLLSTGHSEPQPGKHPVPDRSTPSTIPTFL